MKKNSTITVIICGLAAMFATVVFYLLAFDNIFTIPMRWLSMTGLLFVEIVGTAKALTVRKNILGVAQIITGALHLLATLVLSVVFVNLFPLLIKEYVLLSILFFIIVAVIDVLLLYFKGKSQVASESYAASASVIDICETKVRQLWVENKEAAFSSQLEAIVEMLTYANRAMTAASDGELLTKIEELGTLISNNESEKVSDLAKQIQNTLKLRIEITKKTGSF